MFQYKGLWGCLVFFFFSSLITPHSIFVTHHSSLITHNLKYPNFLYPPVWHTSLSFLSLKFFYFFVGPIPVNWSIPSIKPTCGTHSPPFSLFSFSLHPFTPVTLSLHLTLSTTKLTSSAFFSTRRRSSQTHKQITQ